MAAKPIAAIAENNASSRICVSIVKLSVRSGNYSEHAHFHQRHAGAEPYGERGCQHHGVHESAEGAYIIAVEHVAEGVEERDAGHEI